MTFEEDVLAVLLALEEGEVVSYGEVADQAGHPGAARAVGTLLRTTAVEVPWWRVVSSDGSLRSQAPREQARRLLSEGVAVKDRRVDR